MRTIYFKALGLLVLGTFFGQCKPDDPVIPEPTALGCTIYSISPANNSTGLGTSVYLRWSTCDSASLYELQVSTSDAFTGIVQNLTVTDTSITLNQQPSTTYYWRVRGARGSLKSGWSSIRQFSTQAGIQPNVVLDTIYPGGPWENIKLPFPVYNLPPIQAPSRYRLQVCHDSAFFFSPTPANPFEKLLDPGQALYGGNYWTYGYNSNSTYYWRYRVEVNGVPGAWSPIYSFTTQDMRDIIVGSYRVKKYKAWSGFHPQEGNCPSSLCRIDMGETDIIITKLNTGNDKIRVQEVPGGVINDFWYNPSTGGSYFIPSSPPSGSAKAYFNYYLDSFKIEYDWRRNSVQDYGYLFMAPNPYR